MLYSHKNMICFDTDGQIVINLDCQICVYYTDKENDIVCCDIRDNRNIELLFALDRIKSYSQPEVVRDIYEVSIGGQGNPIGGPVKSETVSVIERDKPQDRHQYSRVKFSRF